MIFKMAFKNLFAHKAKTIITLLLIGGGTFLIILGLGILNYSIEQTEKVCISDFSGDLLIVGKPQKDDVTVELLGALKKNLFSFGKSPKMPYIGDFEKLTSKLKSMSQIRAYTPSVVCSASVLEVLDLDPDWEEKQGTRQYKPAVRMLGIQPETYSTVFDTIQIYEGSFPSASDVSFFLIPKKTKEDYEKYYDTKLNIGDEIIINSYMDKLKIQKVVVTGFFNYAHPETAIDGITYSDLSTCRKLAGMTLGAETVAEIPDSVDLGLSDLSEDDLFSGDALFEENAEANVENINIDDVENILGNTELRDKLNLANTDAWNHIALRLVNPNQTAEVQKELTDWFKTEGLSLEVLQWNKAMGLYQALIGLTKKVLIVALILLSVVVLIVIMNTLVVSVMERTSEIGTMRAIGASKNFVTKIFYAESFVMSLSGVIIGIVLAFLVALIVNKIDIKLNSIVALLFGVYYIKVSISVMAVLGTSLAMLLSGFLANLYPVGLALNISPQEAINK